MSLEGKVIVEMKKIEKTLVIPDFHAPYEDYQALHAVYKYAKDSKPDKVIMLGDCVDFYAISKFSRNPDRITSLQHEIDVVRYHFQHLREAVGDKTPILYVEGNHEMRLQKYLWMNPEMSSLKKINTVPALLGLDDFGIKYVKNTMVHGVLVKHGNIVRSHSAYTAKGEYDSEGTSGISGHSHRISAFYHTDRSGAHAWYEMGHLCDLSQAEYMEGRVANWQQGFGVMLYNPERKTWKVEQVPIINNSFFADGKVYKWNKTTSYPDRVALDA
jgi:predicted phosphodiesterase